MPANKRFISAQQLLDASFSLGLKIYESDFRPNFIIGIWRGGAPVGIAVQELLEYLGVVSDHIAIRTSSYAGIGKRKKQIDVHGLNYIIRQVNAEDSLLIVDDVHDTGLSVQQVIEDLHAACGKNTPTIKIATPWYKPANNQTGSAPDYFVYETNDWLVFPHELDGLSVAEIIANKPGIDSIRGTLEKMGSK